MVRNEDIQKSVGDARKLLCDNRRGKVSKDGSGKSSGYSIDFWDGKWVVSKTAYYNKTLSKMPVVCENRCSLQARIDKAIVDAVIGFVELAKMDGGDNDAAD